MIHYLKGKVEFKDEKFAIVEVAGVGYKVFCSPNTLKKVFQGKEIKLFTYLYLREKAVELYGFLSQKELELFETLNDISGIGPKTATMLASLGSLEKLKEIMEKGQLPPEIKGIGRKKSQKIFLELTGKIKELKEPSSPARTDEALDSLISLGFNRQKAKVALEKIPKEIEDNEKKIKEALKILGRG
jgi:Holliday junction DNA helicase RuvA